MARTQKQNRRAKYFFFPLLLLMGVTSDLHASTPHHGYEACVPGTLACTSSPTTVPDFEAGWKKTFDVLWGSNRLSFPYHVAALSEAVRRHYGILSMNDLLPPHSRTNLTVGQEHLMTLSRDGQTIVLVDHETSAVCLHNLITGQKRLVSPPPFGKDQIVYDPDWSHHEGYILFQSARPIKRNTFQGSRIVVLDTTTLTWKTPEDTKDVFQVAWADVYRKPEHSSGPYANVEHVYFFKRGMVTNTVGEGKDKVENKIPSKNTQLCRYELKTGNVADMRTFAEQLTNITVDKNGRILWAENICDENVTIFLPSAQSGALECKFTSMAVERDQLKYDGAGLVGDKVHIALRDSQNTDKLVPVIRSLESRRGWSEHYLTEEEEDALLADVSAVFCDPENPTSMLGYKTNFDRQKMNFTSAAASSHLGILLQMVHSFVADHYPDSDINGSEIAKDRKRLALCLNSPSQGHQTVVLDLPPPAAAATSSPAGEADNQPRETFVHRSYPALDGVRDRFAQTDSIVVPMRDGSSVQVYVTLPKNASHRPFPTVFHEHGGPHSRHKWGFNPLAQFFASRGMAVVETNQTGSSGFGKMFMNAGDGQWGRRMTSNIIDVWMALVEGTTPLGTVIDPRRVAVMGASYGAYSALELAVQFPDHFQACITVNGLYDLPAAVAEAQADKTCHSALNAVRQRLEAVSPFYQILQARRDGTPSIKAPVLMFHGADDANCLPVQAMSAATALMAAGHSVRYYELAGEGHDLNKDPRNLRFIAMRAELFLAKHLGTYADPAHLQRLEGSTAKLKVRSW